MKKNSLIWRLTFMLIFLSGCGYAGSVKTQPRIQNCLPNHPSINYKQPVYTLNAPKFVLILMDQSSENIINTKYESQIINDEILPSLGGGDRLIIAYMDNQISSKSIIIDKSIDVIQPQIIPTLMVPQKIPTLTLDPNMATTQKGLQQGTSVAILNNNQEEINQYYCNIEDWNNNSEESYQTWVARNNEVINNVKESVKNKLDEIVSMNVTKEKSIYRSLAFASQMINNEKNNKNYSKYDLIVFSNFGQKNEKEEPEDGISIDLSGINTFVITPECKYFDCQAKADWDVALKRFGALDPFISDHIMKESLNNIRECKADPNIAYNKYIFNDHKPKYLLFLVDRSNKYQDYSKAALNIINNYVVGNLANRDRLIVSWLDLYPSANSIIFDEKINDLAPPKFLPTPNPQLSTSCDIEEWNLESDAIYQEWKNEQDNIKSSIIKLAHTKLQWGGTDSTTNGKEIYETLEFASKMIAASKNANSEIDYYLIVFSDMYDWRSLAAWESTKPEDINLSGINTIIIPQNCNYASACDVKNIWESRLEKFGANNVKYIYGEDQIPAALDNDLFANP